MQAHTIDLLKKAQAGSYAIGAFNVYNLEGVKAVVSAAEELNSPAILQIHPAAFDYAGDPLVALSQKAAEQSSMPIALHLDHCSDPALIQHAIASGFSSIMADGAHLNWDQNIAFTQEMSQLAQAKKVAVEAELGLLSGTEDGLTVEAQDEQLTDPAQAQSFVELTKADALAVCIGNVHGKYIRPPQLDFTRLEKIRANTTVPLVMHGTSGLPDQMIQRSIEIGVSKFNVNTALRQAFLSAFKPDSDQSNDLVSALSCCVQAMKEVVCQHMILFQSADKYVEG